MIMMMGMGTPSSQSSTARPISVSFVIPSGCGAYKTGKVPFRSGEADCRSRLLTP
jgi:hypothetical protein